MIIMFVRYVIVVDSLYFLFFFFSFTLTLCFGSRVNPIVRSKLNKKEASTTSPIGNSIILISVRSIVPSSGIEDSKVFSRGGARYNDPVLEIHHREPGLTDYLICTLHAWNGQGTKVPPPRMLSVPRANSIQHTADR